MLTGDVTRYGDRGLGFIAPSSGGAPVFFHFSALANPDYGPEVGDLVSYQTRVSPKTNRIEAYDVRERQTDAR